MKYAMTWFEIGTANLARAIAFYEAVLGHKMRIENIGPSEGAVFAYDEAAGGTGGPLLCGPTAPQPGLGFFAHITDLDGNRVGLHALA